MAKNAIIFIIHQQSVYVIFHTMSVKSLQVPCQHHTAIVYIPKGRHTQENMIIRKRKCALQFNPFFRFGVVDKGNSWSKDAGGACHSARNHEANHYETRLRLEEQAWNASSGDGDGDLKPITPSFLLTLVPDHAPTSKRHL
ncbi:hypothetical protein AAHE18_15G279800 [Arachis hypogaea]